MISIPQTCVRGSTAQIRPSHRKMQLKIRNATRNKITDEHEQNAKAIQTLFNCYRFISEFRLKIKAGFSFRFFAFLLFSFRHLFEFDCFALDIRTCAAFVLDYACYLHCVNNKSLTAAKYSSKKVSQHGTFFLKCLFSLSNPHVSEILSIGLEM